AVGAGRSRRHRQADAGSAGGAGGQSAIRGRQRGGLGLVGDQGAARRVETVGEADRRAAAQGDGTRGVVSDGGGGATARGAQPAEGQALGAAEAGLHVLILVHQRDR